MSLQLLFALFLGLLGATLMMFSYAAAHGRRARSRSAADVRAHRDHVNMFFTFLMLAVVTLELLLHQLPPRERDWIFWVHMCFIVITSVSLILMRVKLTGLANAPAHRRLSRVVFVGFAGLLATGTPLVLRLHALIFAPLA